MHSSSIMCAIKIKCYGSCVWLVVGCAIYAEARCLWKMYISIGGVDTDMPADRQGHECAQLLMNTHAHKKHPSPNTDEDAEDATCINRKAQNQSCHPQPHYYRVFMIFHHLPFYFLQRNLFFASLGGFLFCLLAGALSAREKNKLEPNSEEYAHLNLHYDYV